MESWSDRLIEFASNSFDTVKEKISNGVDKIKDPEFQEEVKQKMSNAFIKTKEVSHFLRTKFSGNNSDFFESQRKRDCKKIRLKFVFSFQ